MPSCQPASRAACARLAGDFAEAEDRYKLVIARYPLTDAAAESQYWAGVARYKATSDHHALIETARAFEQRYKDSQ